MLQAAIRDNIVVFLDVDGVIADITKRLKHIDCDDCDKNFDAFYGAEMADDEPLDMNIQLVIGMLDRFKNTLTCKTKVVALTGRPKRTATLTKMWFDKNCPRLAGFIDEWAFRPDGDLRKANKFKPEKARSILLKLRTEAEHAGGDWGCIIIDDDPTNCIAIEEQMLMSGVSKDDISTFIVNTNQLEKMKDYPFCF